MVPSRSLFFLRYILLYLQYAAKPLRFYIVIDLIIHFESLGTFPGEYLKAKNTIIFYFFKGLIVFI